MMIESLTPIQLAACGAVLFAAYFVRGIAGFGSALVAVPLLALMLPVPFVVPIIVLLDNIASLGHGARNFHHIQWRELLPLIPFTLLGIVTALFALNHLEPGLLTAALGAFVIVYAIWSLLPLPPLRGSRWWAAPLGTLAGVIGTLFGTGGPFTVIYLGLRQLEKAAFRGTIATIFVLDGGMRIVGFGATGLYSADSMLVVLMGLPFLAAGLWLGGHVHVNLRRETFVRFIALVLLGSGAALIAK